MKNRTPEPNARRRLLVVSCLLLTLCAAGAFLLSCEVLDIRGRGAISITTQPTGCEVYIDGDATGDTTNCVLSDIPKGLRMTLGLAKEDYLDWRGWIEVSGVDTLYIDKTFTGSLKVTSTPSGAGIILDGESTSQTTPHTFDSLIVGTHSLRLEHEGAATLDSSIIISYAEQTDISVELSKHYGYLQVQSTPTGAEIWLDGSNTGYTTNHLLENVGVGSHTLKLVKESYSEWDTSVTVSEGQTVTVSATLEEATGNIQVNSTPTNAAIYLDDNNTGKTTNALLEDITIGSHTVKLVKDDYEDWQQEVTVHENQTTTINANLDLEVGGIQVNSTPAGAMIYLDDSYTGEITNILLENIIPGSHTVKLIKAGYERWKDTLTVVKGRTDTVNVTLSAIEDNHDVGVTDLYLSKEPDEPPDYYAPGSVLAIWADVENFGEWEEWNFDVRCRIRDMDAETFVYDETEMITFLDWPGNELGNPFVTSITFAQWIVPSENCFEICCFTDLYNDEDILNDTTVIHINTGISKNGKKCGSPYGTVDQE
jgi:hypothetical protein